MIVENRDYSSEKSSDNIRPTVKHPIRYITRDYLYLKVNRQALGKKINIRTVEELNLEGSSVDPSKIKVTDMFIELRTVIVVNGYICSLFPASYAVSLRQFD